MNYLIKLMRLVVLLVRVGEVQAEPPYHSQKYQAKLNHTEVSPAGGIKKKVAEVGHDTDKVRAKDEMYSSLPGCCQYDRPPSETVNNVQAARGTEASLTVYGNCGMCKRRIEGALKKIAGVKIANWDAETKVLAVNYDTAQTNLDEIQKTIAGLGHDTDKYGADDKVYENLPGCCQYDRPKG